MGYIAIENFSGGMDNSRPIYAGNVGTLWLGVNGHISRGGDFEKRKKFALHASIADEKSTSALAFNPSISADSLVSRFIGFAYDNAGVVAYVNKSMVALAPLPSIRYVLIKHPIQHYFDDYATAAGVPVPPEFPKAISISDFELFNGKVFMIVKFDTGESIPYYDGQPVWDFVVGINYLHNYGILNPTLSPAAYFFRREIISNHNGKLPTSILATSVGMGSSGEYTMTLSGFSTAAGTQLGVKVYRSLADGSGETLIAESYASNQTTNHSASVLIKFEPEPIATNGAFTSGKYKYTLAFRNVVGGGSLNIGLRAKPSSVGSFIKTYGRKIYMTGDSLMDFSGVDDPTLFDRDDDAGAGFINMSNQTSGSEKLVAIESYQDRMAVFSRGNIQIWYVDADPDKNVPSQNLNNTGTRAPKSVTSYGDIDVFYLSDTGIRSIRARDSTNSAAVNDVGTPIDTFLQAHLRSLEASVVERATSVVEPIDGRYMLAVGRKIFVFSYFPSKRISGWSYYDVDFDIDDFFVRDGRVYCVSGRTLYLLGGASGLEYGDDYEVIALLPFISVRKPATGKQIMGADIVATGEWDYSLLTNPNDTNEMLHFGKIVGVSTDEANIAGYGFFTHVAPRLIHKGAGEASISSVIVHYAGGADE